MTSVRERRISQDELRFIGVACQRCGAEYVVDVAKQVSCENIPPRFECVFCNAPFDSQVGPALIQFCKWYQRLAEAKVRLFFRLPETDEEKKGGNSC